MVDLDSPYFSVKASIGAPLALYYIATSMRSRKRGRHARYKGLRRIRRTLPQLYGKLLEIASKSMGKSTSSPLQGRISEFQDGEDTGSKQASRELL